MPKPVRASARRARATAKAPVGSSASPTIVPRQTAVRYSEGHESIVAKALGALGSVEPQRSTRMLILHHRPGLRQSALETLLDDLHTHGAIDFATPVMHDRHSGTRQLLTDEIVLRLKPGPERSALAAMKAAHGVKVVRRNEFEKRQFVVKLPDASGTTSLEVARSLDRRDDVEFASPNYITALKR